MNYKPLGKTGLLVSELCMGTMSFGSDADITESQKMFNLCRDRGINFFDCADVYAAGESEKILGKFIKECRNEIILTSKFTFRAGSGVNDMGSSRYHLRASIENSLKRLSTDRIDIYFVHSFDPLTPIEETLDALNNLVLQGKILYIGVSNWAAWQIATGLGISRLNNISRIHCIQPMYNLLKRQVEVEIFPLAEYENLGVITYSPIAAGLLTGKYSLNRSSTAGRINQNKNYNLRYSKEIYFDIAEKFKTIADKEGVNPVTLALSWVKHNKAVTSPIIGGRNCDQLSASLDSVNFNLSEELYNEISSISLMPPNATDRIEEQLNPDLQLRR